MNKPALDDTEATLNDFFEAMSRLMFNRQQHQAVALDLTLPQAQMLRALRPGSLSTGELATELRISPSSLTQLSDRMIRKGLIERQTSPTDRRSVIVALSAKGKRVVDQFRDRRSRIFKEALGGLSSKDQIHVIEAMHLVVIALETYEKRSH
ncbi:MAG TPA: MarR family transcriptional regulator [Pyrinomonadaceae bacterium]|jgi:DNA-binding MarR family transcriptional regulator|nr:MarR family transcriptional regulator [Pyrinomonadaceae bacterium]